MDDAKHAILYVEMLNVKYKSLCSDVSTMFIWDSYSHTFLLLFSGVRLVRGETGKHLQQTVDNYWTVV